MNIIGIFCEDIREETSGLHTVIGIMPDGLILPPPPKGMPAPKTFIPKMGLYIRASFSIDETVPESIAASIRLPGSEEPLRLGEMTREHLAREFASAKEKKSPILGIIFKATVSPLQIDGPGPSTLHLSVDGKDHLCGILHIEFEGKAPDQPSLDAAN